MVFNSVAYLFFLPAVFIVHWLLPHRLRWILLLTASYYFYMCWNVKYVFLILFTTVISYISGILTESIESKRGKKLALTAVICASLGVLVVFKYFNFLSDLLTDTLSLFAIPMQPITVKLLLPIGISFYTFQTLSYVVDVYRGKIKAERHFGYYALFVSFFPQLVAGPIERPENLLPQLKTPAVYDYTTVAYGFKLMTWGFFKKMIIADNLSEFVNRVFADTSSYTGLPLILATLLFQVQAYCDFSGYSDIARGTANTLGVNLMTNFKSPLFSQNMHDYWVRWHISLGTWFRDYVYFPLGGSRVGKIRRHVNLLITFLLSGLWHGANLTFVIWGGLNGLYLIIEDIFFRPPRKPKGQDPKAAPQRSLFRFMLNSILVLLVFCTTLVLFRSPNVKAAWFVYSHLFDGIGNLPEYLLNGYQAFDMHLLRFAGWITPMALLLVFDYYSMKQDVIAQIGNKPTRYRWGCYYAFMLYCLFYLVLCSNFSTQTFVYFQF